MSSKPAQSHLLERVASRRNVVRGAAWTTAAVTVVVATPNIAAATTIAVAPSVTVTSIKLNKHGAGSTKYVSWDLEITCANMELDGLVLLFTYLQKGGGKDGQLSSLAVRNYAPSPAISWTAGAVTKSTMTATATSSYGGVVPKSTPLHVHAQFQGTDNSSGEAGVTLMAKDSKGFLVQVGSIGPSEWGTSAAHDH